MEDYIIWFDHLGMSDVDRVGGKNASLGEMISNLANAGVTVPGGFATTAHAYREFLATDGLKERIDEALDALDINDVNELARVGAKIRQWIIETPFPDVLENALKESFAALQDGNEHMAVAVRSSATAEDLPGCLLCRPAGNLPERGGAATGAHLGQGSVCVAVQ